MGKMNFVFKRVIISYNTVYRRLKCTEVFHHINNLQICDIQKGEDKRSEQSMTSGSKSWQNGVILGKKETTQFKLNIFRTALNSYHFRKTLNLARWYI